MDGLITANVKRERLCIVSFVTYSISVWEQNDRVPDLVVLRDASASASSVRKTRNKDIRSSGGVSTPIFPDQNVRRRSETTLLRSRFERLEDFQTRPRIFSFPKIIREMSRRTTTHSLDKDFNLRIRFESRVRIFELYLPRSSLGFSNLSARYKV